MANPNSTGVNRLMNGDLSPSQAQALGMELGGYYDHGNSGTTQTVSIENGVVHKITLNNNCALTLDGANGSYGSALTLILVQDGTGSRTVSYTNTVKWAGGSAPTLTTTAAGVDILSFLTVDGGTTWYGFTSGLAFA